MLVNYSPMRGCLKFVCRGHSIVQQWKSIAVDWAGAVLEGFLRFPETTQDFPSTTRVHPFSATTFYEAYTAGWIAVVTGLYLYSKLRKCSEDLFFLFWSPRRKIEDLRKNLCCRVTALREDLTVRVRDKQAAWKLLSEISRTAPGLSKKYVCYYWKECINFIDAEE